MLDGIEHALKDGERTLGITSKIILCFLRHLSAEAAMETLEQALPYRNRIVGVGLDSSEKGHPPAKFKAVFERARDLDFRVVAHARSEEHTSELQSLMRISYAVFCLNKRTDHKEKQ